MVDKFTKILFFCRTCLASTTRKTPDEYIQTNKTKLICDVYFVNWSQKRNAHQDFLNSKRLILPENVWKSGAHSFSLDPRIPESPEISSSASHHLHPANTLQPRSNTHITVRMRMMMMRHTILFLFSAAIRGRSLWVSPETSPAKINTRNPLIALSRLPTQCGQKCSVMFE